MSGSHNFGNKAQVTVNMANINRKKYVFFICIFYNYKQ